MLRSEECLLTRREAQVLKLIGEARTNKEISQLLGVSIETIASHRKNICKKLNLHSTASLVAYATRHMASGAC